MAQLFDWQKEILKYQMQAGVHESKSANLQALRARILATTSWSGGVGRWAAERLDSRIDHHQTKLLRRKNDALGCSETLDFLQRS